MIEIQSTPAKIGITTTPTKQYIQQPNSELSIEQQQAKLNISTTPSRLSIDQSKAWHDMDLKNIFERTREWADKGYQDLLEGIGRLARQGDELMKIENKGNPIASQARENSSSKPFEFNYGTLPKTHFRVEIDYEPSQVIINVERRHPKINITPRPPEISYEVGKIDIYLTQKNSFTMSYKPKVDQKA